MKSNRSEKEDIQRRLEPMVSEKLHQVRKLNNAETASSVEAAAGSHSSSSSSLPSKPKPWEREKLWKHVPSMLFGDSMTSGEFRFSFSEDLDTYDLIAMPQLRHIRLKEDHKEIGNRVWDGAVIFSRWLEQCIRRKYINQLTDDDKWWCMDVKNRRFLEIGAGTGIVGIVVTALGAKSVVCTDLVNITHTTRHPVKNLALQDHIQVVPLEWGNQSQTSHLASLHEYKPFDAIIASDLAAPLACADELIETLKVLMKPNGGIREAWILLQHHREFTEPFVSGIEHDSKFHLRQVPMTVLPEEFQSDRHSIYKLTTCDE